MSTSLTTRSPVSLRTAAYRSAAASILAGLSSLRRSRSLASIMPSFLASGVLTLISTAVIHWTSAPIEGEIATWLESWLIAWGIVFPIAYIAGLSMKNIALLLTSPVEQDATLPSRSARSALPARLPTARTRNSFTVLRNLKIRQDFSV